MTLKKVLLQPLNLIYGTAIGLRNFLFHISVLKSRTFTVPILCIGNITVGGTGKTPHAEMIIAALKKNFKVASLSRGYKRKTSGFILAGPKTTAREIGDEPMQIKCKFPDITVACDADRVRGIQKLLQLPQKPEVIILDDAFQHRYVQADKNIILMDYHRPVYEDSLLPAGRLRERVSALKRADYIIVTKCPRDMQPIERRIVFKNLKIKPYQQLYFTYMEYGQIKTLTGDTVNLDIHKNAEILCITGIARPEPYIEHLKTFTENIQDLRYPDHHNFRNKDIRNIEKTFNAIVSQEKYIFTTEKDAVRLRTANLPEELEKLIFYIPIEPAFVNNEDQLLNELSEYVRKNQK